MNVSPLACAVRLLFVSVVLACLVPADAQETIREPIRRMGLGPLGESACSPDGKVIATVGGGGVYLWDLETGQLVREFIGHRAKVNCVAFSPDGSRLITGSGHDDDGSRDFTVRLWDVGSALELQTLEGHTQILSSVAFSRDGTRFASTAYDGTARIWDTSGNLIRVLDGGDGASYSVSFSADGTRVVVGGHESAKLWDVSSATVIDEFSGLVGSVTSVSFSPDGTRILTASGGYNFSTNEEYGEARLWDVATGNLIRTFPRHQTSTIDAAFSPDGNRVATASGDKTVRLHDANSGSLLRTFQDTGEFHSVSFTPDGTRLLTGAWDHTVKLWSIDSGSVVQNFTGHTEYVFAGALSPAGDRVLTANGFADGDVHIWDALEGKRIGSLNGNADGTTCVSYSPDGSLIATGNDHGEVLLWNTATGTLLRTLDQYSASVRSVSFSPDGSALLSSGFGSARISEVASGQHVRTFTIGPTPVESARFSPDGGRIVAAANQKAYIFDRGTGAEVRILTSPDSGLFFAAYNRAGNRVITTDYESAKLWDAETGALVREFDGAFKSASFSPNGERILFASSFASAAHVYDINSGEQLTILSRHTGWTTTAVYSDDGNRILTTSEDGTAVIWDSGLREKEKVIVVAGGGPYPGNSIANQTRSLAEQTHLTATIRGIAPDSILYLSSFETPAANIRVDGPATVAALQEGILSWAGDARRLTVFLLDHGEWDPVAGEWYFYVDASKTPRQILTGAALDEMLDQAQQMGLRELVVVVDSCYSGGFIRKASSHPAGTERIVIASTTDDRLAQYGGGRSANFSFTNLFLSQLLKGANVQEAYLEAQSTIQSLQVPRSAPQSPLLEDTGDGRTTGRDGAKARTYVLGKAAPFGALPPELLTVSADMQFPAPQGVPVEATVGFGRVDGVEAVVTWSDQYYADGSPINELTVLPLNRQGTSTRWTATLPASAFPGNGLYTVVFNAYRKDPLAGEIRYTSNTIVQRIAVGEAAAVAVQLMLLAPSSLLNDRNGDGIVDAADLL